MKGVMQMILHRKSMRLSVLILSILMMISMLMPSSAVFADDNAGGDVKKGSALIAEFGGYKVNAEVTVKDGKILGVEVEGSDFKGSDATVNKVYLDNAIKGMKDKFNNIDVTDAKKINSVDTVTNATVSSKVIRGAVLDALNLKVPEEEEPLPDKVPAPGKYTVTIQNMTESVQIKNAKPGNKGMGVAHSLLGEDSAQGILDVDSNGKMKLSYVFVSGTNKSPLYVLKYNGYYKNDDPSIEGDLVKENADVKEFKWIANNELNGVSDTVVGKVTRPLGKISDAYYDEVKLYVPAMQGLNKPGFDNGKFTAVTKISLKWSTLKRVQEPKLANGEYTVNAKVIQPDGSESMADGALKKPVTIKVKGGKYYLHVGFQKMGQGTAQGYLGSAKYFNSGYSVEGNKINGGLSPVDIEEYHKNEYGNNISDEYGTDYPKTVSFEMIPEAKIDGKVPMQFTIPAMEALAPGHGTKSVFLKLDWSSVKKKAGKPVAKKKPAKKKKVNKIKLSKMKLKAKAMKKRRVKLTWNRVKKASGYVIYMKTSKKGKLKVVKVIKGAKKTKLILKKLKKNKRCYFLIKAFKNKSNKKIFVAISKVMMTKMIR